MVHIHLFELGCMLDVEQYEAQITALIQADLLNDKLMDTAAYDENDKLMETAAYESGRAPLMNDKLAGTAAYDALMDALDKFEDHPCDDLYLGVAKKNEDIVCQLERDYERDEEHVIKTIGFHAMIYNEKAVFEDKSNE